MRKHENTNLAVINMHLTLSKSSTTTYKFAAKSSLAKCSHMKRHAITRIPRSCTLLARRSTKLTWRLRPLVHTLTPQPSTPVP